MTLGSRSHTLFVGNSGDKLNVGDKRNDKKTPLAINNFACMQMLQ